jgi:hypothetical protein
MWLATRIVSSVARFFGQDGAFAMFIIEFPRVRVADEAHATLDRVEQDTNDLEGAKVRAQSLFETLDIPQKPDTLRILDQSGEELFFWSPQSGGS